MKMIWQWQRFLVKPTSDQKSRSENVDPIVGHIHIHIHKIIRARGMAMAHINNTVNQTVDIGINELWKRRMMGQLNEI
jgi:hypothetical protein